MRVLQRPVCIGIDPFGRRKSAPSANPPYRIGSHDSQREYLHIHPAREEINTSITFKFQKKKNYTKTFLHFYN